MLRLVVFAYLALTAIAAPMPDGKDKLASPLPSDLKDFVHDSKWLKAVHSPYHFDHKNCSDGPSVHPSSTPTSRSGAKHTSLSTSSHKVAAHSSSSPSSSAAPTKPKSTSPSPTSSTHSGSAASPTSSVSASAAAYLDPQNALRAKHNAAAFTWSSELASYAQAWVNKCQWKHSDGPHGENLAAGTGNFGPGDAVWMWASEEPDYDRSNPQPSHYTQVVWKSSRQVGCASAPCPDLLGEGTGTANFIACEYDPAGNVLGEFPANVS